jgi:hypothetical protein
MITCFIEYRIDRRKEAAFERWCRMWLELIPRFGGVHHGYFLPSEGRSDVAMGLFSFPSFAAYEEYRAAAATDPDASEASRFRDDEAGVLEWDRRFFRPLLPTLAE